MSITVPLLGVATFSVTASSGTTMSYQWYQNGYPVAGATSSTYVILSVLSSSAGTYVVKITNAGGTVTSSGATLAVLTPPGIATQPQSQTVALGQNASFSVVANGSGPFSYQWNFNGSAIAGATDSTLVLTGVQTNQAGGYSVVIANTWGATNSAVASLLVIVPPTITTQPQSLNVAQHQAVSLSVGASGTAPFTCQWYFNNSALGGSGGTSSTYTLNDPGPGNTGDYFAVVANAAGSATSAVATLTVYVPPGIQTQPNNQTVNQGQTASFSVVPNGSPPFSYQWICNGSPMPWAGGASLTLPNAQANQAGSYSVVVSNPIGSVTSQVATLTVIIPPTIITQPQSQWAVQRQSVAFTVVAAGTAPFTYNWYFNGAQLWPNSATLSFSSVNSGNAGNYFVVVGNNAGSVTSAVVTLTVCVPPSIQTQPNNQTVTQGQNATLSVLAYGSAPLKYQWVFNGAAIPGATDPSLTLTNVQAAQAGNYSAVAANACGNITSQVATLTVNIPVGIATSPQSQWVLPGQNVSFTVVPSGTPPFHYRWYFNGTSMGYDNATCLINGVKSVNIGSYYVVVQNYWGSATSGVFTLNFAVAPVIAAQPQDVAVAAGQPAAFSVSASATPDPSYQWLFNGSALDSETNSTLVIANAQTANAGSYSVIVSNYAGAITSAPATLTVLTLTSPPPLLSLPATTGLTAAGFTFQLTAPVGSTYIVFASSDLQTWTPIATNTTTSASAFFTDPAAVNYPVRFYRVLVQ